MNSERTTKETPAMTVPAQPEKSHMAPERNVPNEPPIKYVVINMVFTLLEAC